MTGRHEGPPSGSAAREATASPYHGERRVLAEALDAYPLKDPRLRRLTVGEIEGIIDLAMRVLFPPMAELVCGTSDREAWLAARREGITATDIPVIMDDDPPRCTSCGHHLGADCGCSCCPGDDNGI